MYVAAFLSGLMKKNRQDAPTNHRWFGGENVRIPDGLNSYTTNTRATATATTHDTHDTHDTQQTDVSYRSHHARERSQHPHQVLKPVDVAGRDAHTLRARIEQLAPSPAPTLPFLGAAAGAIASAAAAADVRAGVSGSGSGNGGRVTLNEANGAWETQ